MQYKIMEFQGVAAFLSIPTLVFYEIPKISQGWRNFLARIPINSATNPKRKIKQKKRSPLSLQKFWKLSLANFKSLLKVIYI
jgi:hypothetical protein